MRTLVIGAAGHAAGEVVPALHSRGAWVRGMVRRDAQRALVQSRGAAEVVLGDLRDRRTIDSAMADIQAVFYIAPAFLPDEAAVGVQVIDAAVRAGVRRVVFSSVIHPSLSLINHRAKAPVEEALYDSGLEYTVLQPALFFQNFAGGWERTLATGVLAEPWSSRTRFSRVDYRDVADAAAIALTEDRLLAGTYELAAPGHLDRHDVAALIGEVTGRRIRAERTDPAQLDVAEPMRAMFSHYDHAGLLSNPLALAIILQRDPRTLRDYFEQLNSANPIDDPTAEQEQS
ncbi:NmrA family NAD(P)-binding protein [Naumannella halotolerans]|uniref:Uncharacterized protein YbjT (DUF2867 family) n=1 Tax=Naumannella halotolerans TaxID=993414 RepID=A0A4R7JB20_9ACTN|nr:NmrA family NAD(P)-binding protein [Naumannella halotolerans]TDT33783.1 uncharacterized protein YbjT (DUF2867 family) [Naumannella halotolerans]